MTTAATPSRGIDIAGAAVDFPIFDAKTRSLKKAVLGRAGGRDRHRLQGADHRGAARHHRVAAPRRPRRRWSATTAPASRRCCGCMSGIYEPTRGRPSVPGRSRRCSTSRWAWTRRSPASTTSSSAGCSSGMTRKQMEARVDDIAAFTELGDYLSMPLRTYSTGMRVRLALGVVTSIDPEILLLDEGIGAVDAEFLAKARTRLFELVERSGILVFASHSDEFLARPVRHRDLARARHDPRARAAARGAAPLQGPRRPRRDGTVTAIPAGPVPPGSVVAVVVTRHRSASSSSTRWPRWRSRRIRSRIWSSSTTGRTSPRARSWRSAGIPATWLPSWRNLGGAGGFALGMLHALALGADWVWLGDDDGRAADETVLATLLDVAQRRMLAAVSPVVVDADDPERLAFTVRRGLTWHTSRATLAAEARRRAAQRDRGVLQRRAVPRRRAGDDRRAGPAAVRPRRRGGAAPADGAVQAAVRHQPGCGLPAPARHRRPQAHARRPAARPAPRRRREARTTPTATAATS